MREPTFSIRLRTLSTPLLCLVAMLWPLRAYETIPGISLSATALILLVLFPIAFLDYRLRGRWRVPFEYMLPGLLLLLVGGWTLFQQHTSAGAVFRYGLTLLAVVHLAGQRDTIERCCWLSSCTGTVVAGLSIASAMGFFFPTSYIPGTTICVAFAYTLPDAVLTLALCALAGLLAANSNLFPSRLRKIALCNAILCGAFLFYLLVRSLANLCCWHPGSPLSGSWLQVTARLLLCWLAVRIIAKLWIAHTHYALAHIPVLLFIPVTLLLFLLLFPSHLPSAGAFFLLGLSAAYPLPERTQPAAYPFPSFAPLLTTALLCINLFYINPENAYDPRNYTIGAAKNFRVGRFAHLLQQMDYIDARSPGEAQTHYWRAQAAREQGNMKKASEAFARAVLAQHPRLLPPLSAMAIDRFLDQLRDDCSALPDEKRGLSYEYALVAAGQQGNALNLLAFRTEKLPAAQSSYPEAARSLAVALGDSALENLLAQWEPRRLSALYEAWLRWNTASF